VINTGLINRGHSLVNGGILRVAAPGGLAIPAPTVFYRMNGASGADEVDTVGGLNLTQHNTVGSVAGKIGNARTFASASQQYLDHVDHASFRLTGTFTLAVWAYAATNATFQRILAKGDANNNTDYNLAFDYSANRIVWTSRNSSNAVAAQLVLLNSAPTTATWYCCAVKFVSGTGYFWSLNGSAWTAGTGSTATRDSGTRFVVGAEDFAGGQTQYLNGRADALSIWNGTALSSTEIALFYNGVAGSGAGTEYYSGLWN
jgi:hypothetical protein